MANRNEEVIIFANGPYQLLVGLSCARQHIENLDKVFVFLYDMKWQKDLESTCLEFSQILGLKNVSFSFECQKSDVTNKHTHPIRSIINLLTFFCYSLFNPVPHVFIPKLYGSPERAVILASLRKKIYIFDDGFGMYLDPSINQNKFDQQLYSFIDRYFSKQKANLLICPRNPDLMDYSDFHGIRISTHNYSSKLMDNFQIIASHYSEILRQHFGFQPAEKEIILIALPRLAFTDQQRIGDEIQILIKEISNFNPNVYFLLKPHPRDLIDDLADLTHSLESVRYWEFLPDKFSPFPIEVICIMLDASIIISGYSTVGINGDLLTKSRVMVFDFLSFNIPHYNKFAQSIMIKAGSYAGETVQEAVKQIRLILNGAK